MYCLPSRALEVVYQRKVLWEKVLHTDEGSKYQKKCTYAGTGREG